MPPTPLFTRGELADAFALVFRDRAAAERVAGAWFARIAGDDVDAAGRFVYTDWRDVHPDLAGDPDVIDDGPPPPDSPAARARGGLLPGWTDDEKAEFLLRFSDFHLDLVALVSADLFERMRAARGLEPAAAERSRAQMARVTALLRG